MEDRLGTGCYQASTRYLDWLYFRNPAGRGLRDGLVAIDGDRVVGCSNRFRVVWRVGGRPVEIPALIDLAVDRDAPVSAAMMLIRTALRDDPLLIVPATTNLAGVYERMGGMPIASTWLRRDLLPRRFRPFFRKGAAGASLLEDLPKRRTGSFWDGVHLISEPNSSEITALLRSLDLRATGSSPIWSEESLSWRLFDSEGPVNVVIRLTGFDDAGLLLSLGCRGRWRFTRIIGVFGPRKQVGRLVQVACRLSAQWGAIRILAATDDDDLRGAFLRAGFGLVKHQPTSWVFGMTNQLRPSFQPLAMDQGFDGISRQGDSCASAGSPLQGESGDG